MFTKNNSKDKPICILSFSRLANDDEKFTNSMYFQRSKKIVPYNRYISPEKKFCQNICFELAEFSSAVLNSVYYCKERWEAIKTPTKPVKSQIRKALFNCSVKYHRTKYKLWRRPIKIPIMRAADKIKKHRRGRKAGNKRPEARISPSSVEQLNRISLTYVEPVPM